MKRVIDNNHNTGKTMFNLHECRDGSEIYTASCEDVGNLKYLLTEVVEQLLATKSPDMSLVNFNLDEIASLLDI